MRKPSLAVYVVSAVIIISVVDCIVWFINQPEANGVMIFSLGFLLGMLAMYIAVHLYRWK